MIKKIKIQNFQSHKDTTLKLDEGVNVIVGSSDSGKSSIIRALKWLVWNRPLGDSIRSHWGGETSVQIELQEGTTITRKKDKQEEYILGDSVFHAFRTDVPEEIVKALNLTEINLQQQLDSPFLLSKSPGEVATHFNRVAHLEVIGTALQNIQSWIRKKESDLTYSQQQVQSLDEGLHSYDYIEKAESEIEVLEGLETQGLTKQKQLSQLRELVQSIEDTTLHITELTEIVKDEKLVNTLLQNIQRKEQLWEKADKLTDLIAQITQIEAAIHALNYTLLAEQPVTELLQLIEARQEKRKTMNEINSAITNLQQTEEELQNILYNITKKEKEFHENMGDTCPLCGQKIKHE